MILNPRAWLSDNPDMIRYPELCEKHCEKYSDTNYNLLFNSGLDFDTDTYIIPVSGKFTTPLSGMPDDFCYEIPQDILDKIESGTCKLVWDMTFEMYMPNVMTWLRAQDTYKWAHRSYDFIQNTQEHYGIQREQSYIALNNREWSESECYISQPICVNKCDAWYYPDTDHEYIYSQCQMYSKGTDFPKKFITTLGEVRQHKIKLARKIQNSDTDWHVSARQSYWEPDINSELRLPWVLDRDLTGIKDHYRPLKPDLLRYMSESMVDVVCDTLMMSTDLTPDYQVTEKPFRSICLFKPMLYLGQPGGLQYLRDLGFKTFGDHWDESYDTITDPDVRYQAVISIINELADDAHAGLKLRGVEKILIYNYEHYQKLIKTNFQLRFYTGSYHRYLT